MQQARKTRRQAVRPFGGAPRRRLERRAGDRRHDRRDERVDADPAQPDTVHEPLLLLADDQQHVRPRGPDRGADEQPPGRGIGDRRDHEQRAAAPHLGETRVEQRRRNRHEAAGPRLARERPDHEALSRSGRPPQGGNARARTVGAKHLGQRRDCGSFHDAHAAIRQRQRDRGWGRIFPLVSAVHTREPDRASVAPRANTILCKQRRGDAGCVQETRRALVDRPRVVGAADAAAVVGLEASAVADQAVVEERGDRSMLHGVQPGAARLPSQLF
jgi:hypothetical protein